MAGIATAFAFGAHPIRHQLFKHAEGTLTQGHIELEAFQQRCNVITRLGVYDDLWDIDFTEIEKDFI